MFAASAAVSTHSADAQTSDITDVDILQFALNLEHLEAEFYTVATTGKTIDAFGIGITGDGVQGATTGGALTAAGVKPVAKPAINLAGLGFGFGGAVDFINVARILEDIGVTAYAGAAPLIQNKDYLGVAARILATEAFHSGNIRLIIAQNRYTSIKLDGVDVPPPPTGTRYFATDDNALSAVRTPAQVLFLAYGLKSNAAGGGFYPAGFNGKLKTSGTSA